MISTSAHLSATPYRHLHKVRPWPREAGMCYSDARTELWLPHAALASCVRGVVARDTRGVALDETQRYNHLPAAPSCALLWYLQGDCHLLVPGTAALPESPRSAVAPQTVCGPFTQPTISWNSGPMHAFMVLLMPDVLAQLTGVDTAALLDRLVPVHELLDAQWQDFFAHVAQAPDDEQRVALVEAFLLPRWQQVRPLAGMGSHHLTDWSRSLALRAASSGLGRSLRQAERRIKQWTGQTLRHMQGAGRSERSFFEAAHRHQAGGVHWGDIAHASGYADQAHMCRDSRRMTGYAPAQLYQRMQQDEGFWIYRLWAYGVSAPL